MNMPQKRSSIREILRASKISEDEILDVVRSEILTWPGRMLDNLRLRFGGDRLTAEFCLLHDIADCTSGADIADAFDHYRSDPTRIRRAAWRFLGLTPRSSRALRYLRKLQNSGA